MHEIMNIVGILYIISIKIKRFWQKQLCSGTLYSFLGIHANFHADRTFSNRDLRVENMLSKSMCSSK